MNSDKIWECPVKNNSALNYPKIWVSHVDTINHTQLIIIKNVFLNSFLIENKCLINLGHTDLGTQEMSSREWWPKWHGSPHAACALSQRLTENTQCEGQWMWWLGKNSTDIGFFKVKLFHCRSLNIIGIQSGCVIIPSAIVYSHSFYPSISLGTFLLLLLLLKQKYINAAASHSMPTYHFVDKGEFALSMVQVN